MKNSFYSTSILFLIFLGISASCSTKNSDSATQAEGVYELVKIDSFQIDNFTRISILDYSAEEKIYLGYSINEDDILEISEDGKILNRAHRKGDGPDLYGTWNPIGLGFGPNGQRIVELPFQVISYNKNYEIKQSHRIMSPLPIRANTPLGRPPYYQKNDTTFLLVGPSNYLTATYLIHNIEGKDTLQNFYQLNLQTGAVKTVVPYESNSIYNSTESIYSELMGKSFFIDHENNELVLVQNLDNEILIYSLSDLSLKRSIQIAHSEFKTYSPVPIGTQFPDPNVLQLSRLSARNQKLLNFGDNTYLLQYFTGISQAEYDGRNSEENPYVGPLDETEQRIIIFEGEKQISKELPGITGSLILPLPGNKILVQERENTEIEEEFTRFSIYQLQSN
ncbi:hypothetical protein [Algoriphagus aquimarinus]|uniref:DUF4221 domain-containing protein n=1 Tax=Algoriphagus aquimarinus TaxID=237018 RepID=A0A5C7AUM2_9BACT|nr:hypothetical protein [Algoriphagus aquimarinus]TXE12446.1 hypothetical protein ESV85_07415 [Algoriphagus aquimarinus]